MFPFSGCYRASGVCFPARALLILSHKSVLFKRRAVFAALLFYFQTAITTVPATIRISPISALTLSFSLNTK